jgi:hypothetical protein
VIAVVHEPLRHVERRDAVIALEPASRDDELVHAEAVVGQVVELPEPSQEVVGVQDCRFGHLAEARPVGADVRVGPDEHAERPQVATHLPDRTRTFLVERE